jgi:hypothetical protein
MYKRMQVIIDNVKVNYETYYADGGRAIQRTYRSVDVDCILKFEDGPLIETSYSGIEERLSEMKQIREYIAGLHNCELIT